MSVKFVGLRKVCQTNVGDSLVLGSKLSFKVFLLFFSDIGESGLKFELFGHNLEFLSGPLDKLLGGS